MRIASAGARPERPLEPLGPEAAKLPVDDGRDLERLGIDEHVVLAEVAVAEDKVPFSVATRSPTGVIIPPEVKEARRRDKELVV